MGPFPHLPVGERDIVSDHHQTSRRFLRERALLLALLVGTMFTVVWTGFLAWIAIRMAIRLVF